MATSNTPFSLLNPFASMHSTILVCGLTISACGLLGFGLALRVKHQTGKSIAHIPFWVPFCFCSFVFLLDIGTPQGVATGIVYVPLIFCSLWFLPTYAPFMFALIGIFLTILAYFFKEPSNVPTWMVLTNRVLTIGALFLTALLVYLKRLSSKALALSENRLSTLVNSVLDGMVTLDEEGKIESCNLAFERIFGYQETELRGVSYTLLIPDEPHSGNDSYFQDIFKTGSENTFSSKSREFIGRRKNGDEFPLELSINAFQSDDGRHFSAIARNIAERKTGEELKWQLAAVVENSGDAIITKTLEGIITSWNIGAQMLFGYLPHEMIGLHVSTLIPLDRRDEEIYILGQVRAGRRVKHYETVRLHKDGHLIDISLTVSPICNAEGKVIGASKIARDITRKKEAEMKIARYTEELEKNNQVLQELVHSNTQLDDFAYIASHDLKAPLRVIDNASKWLEEDLAEHLDSDSKENMVLLRSRVSRMEKLLDDLLEYSRLGKKEDERYSETITVDSLLNDILLLLPTSSEFTITRTGPFEATRVNRMPLQHILLNLISNAIKHHVTLKGSIDVKLEDEGGYFLFKVTDDGPGIPSQYHEQIFKMFQTLKPRDQVEGSGMGLAMVRKYVEIYGGTIKLDSAEGKGSSFQFSWPKEQRPKGKTNDSRT